MTSIVKSPFKVYADDIYTLSRAIDSVKKMLSLEGASPLTFENLVVTVLDRTQTYTIGIISTTGDDVNPLVVDLAKYGE